MEPSMPVDKVREWVARHKVCWELSPLREMVKGEGLRQTGLEIVLLAQIPLTGDTRRNEAEAVESYRGAEWIAQHVMPPEVEGLHCQVEGFDHAAHLRPETQFAPEIAARIRIDVGPRADPRKVQEITLGIEQRLKGLGVQNRVWKQETAATAG
jgi:hypothetical protein